MLVTKTMKGVCCITDSIVYLQVEGFPTLLVYRDGVKVSEYNGARNVDEMYQYLASFFRHDEL